jgi:carboxymethylenebutenolidase
MPKNVHLSAEDGHELNAYVSEPDGTVSGAIVVIQEIFGVNSHIRSVVDVYAREGFVAIAPALFDRAERGIELGYDAESGKRGMALVKSIGIENSLKDVAAAIHYASTVVGEQDVGVVGYCYGGSLAWLAATRLNPAAAVGYYGGQIVNFVNEQPRCPVMLHFGEKDAHIGPDKIARIRATHPEIPLFLYDAGHGFNCDQRESYDAASARLAKQRTLEFLREHLR